MERDLTPKQQRWLAAYLCPARYNATEAAAQAGYAGNRRALAEIGHHTRYVPRVAAAIKACFARQDAEHRAAWHRMHAG